MESNELALGIFLYKGISLSCKDEILKLDFSNAPKEGVIGDNRLT
jgi:hypothetical protein